MQLLPSNEVRNLEIGEFEQSAKLPRNSTTRRTKGHRHI
jgi:hypothetical protein